ncbi:MAG: hypothetical protein ACI3VE_06920 [Oscillospiraceae bacterium]
MKLKLTRILCLILAVSMCAGLLCGCGGSDEPEETPVVFDPEAYVSGGLDAVYHGVFSDEYLKLLGAGSDEGCAESYERGMEVSLDVFAGYFNISTDDCSDEIRTELLALMKDMYKYAKYEVGEASENGDGYTVKVTVYPIAAVADAAREDYPAFAEGAAQRLADGEFDKGGQNFEDWWAQSIADMVRLRLSAKEYLDPVEVSVEISKNDSGAYILSSEALAEIDRYIVSYPAD